MQVRWCLVDPDRTVLYVIAAQARPPHPSAHQGIAAAVGAHRAGRLWLVSRMQQQLTLPAPWRRAGPCPTLCRSGLLLFVTCMLSAAPLSVLAKPQRGHACHWGQLLPISCGRAQSHPGPQVACCGAPPAGRQHTSHSCDWLQPSWRMHAGRASCSQLPGRPRAPSHSLCPGGRGCGFAPAASTHLWLARVRPMPAYKPAQYMHAAEPAAASFPGSRSHPPACRWGTRSRRTCRPPWWT